MCGFVGFCDDSKNKKKIIRDMADIIKHRGPESDGYYVYNNILEEIALENGMYSIENSNFTIHTELEMGGLAPTDNYFINEVEYSGTDLLNYLEEKEYDLDGHLYGKHDI